MVILHNLKGQTMIKEYRDKFLNEDAVAQLNLDILNNPNVSFEILGYSRVTIDRQIDCISTGILVKWGKGFK
ncbi:TPA: hypothetical protein ACJ7HU_001338 [Streptococcus pyogenes]|uniref:hypothetical protein n=1 Tax=Streptococcus pyogenes TaxID=1314 RepID=UPI001D132187|nr:hypothetical protein [Streptococcus pyogenes]